MALSSVSALKIHLGLADTYTDEDTFLAQLLSGVEAAFLKLIKRNIEAREYTLYLGGTNTPVLILPEYPVIEVSGVWLDNQAYWGTSETAFADDTEQTEGTDYALIRDGGDGEGQTARLFKIGGIWPGRWEYKTGLLTPQLKTGAGNVKITLIAGYSPIPADIPLALHQVCAELRAERESGRTVLSESFEDYSITWAAYDFEEAMKRIGSGASIVAQYRRLNRRYQQFS